MTIILFDDTLIEIFMFFYSRPKKSIAMKKLIILMFFLSPLISKSQDFKNFYWGDSVDKIRVEEKPELIINTSIMLVYETQLFSKEVELAYDFVDKKLCTARYSFKINHTNENLYIDDFNSIKETLITKYGNPSQYNEKWKSDLFKDNPSYKGMAIAMGDLSYVSYWELERTIIALYLEGDNRKISLGLAYSSKKCIEEKKKEKNPDFNNY